MAGKLKPLDVQRQEKPGNTPMVMGSISSWPAQHRKIGAIDTGSKAGNTGMASVHSFKDVSLKEARLARDVARLQVRAGVDPVQKKRSAREEWKAAIAVETAKIFEECAQGYIDEHWNTWSAKHRAQRPCSLKPYAYPTIGQLTYQRSSPAISMNYSSRSGLRNAKRLTGCADGFRSTFATWAERCTD
jgi:hypothetical protein